MLARIISGLAGWAAALFQRIERRGNPLPAGPVLVVANHPNSLLDPLVIFRTGGRLARPLAKAPLFEGVLLGPLLRGLGGLPVYRREDDPGRVHQNEDTFRAAVDALHRGEVIQIYPEGISHSEPTLAPLRTGAARIALRAEETAGWALGLQVVPVGLTYTRKESFRGHVVALYGDPMPAAPYRELHERDPVEAVRVLTDAISESLEAVTLNFTESEDRELVEAAERLWIQERAERDEGEGLGSRLPRLQEFARGLAWLRADDPERHRRLAGAVERYRRMARRVGRETGRVPDRYPLRSVLTFSAREGILLLVGAPVAALGAFLWYVPYVLPRLALRWIRPEHQRIATYKLVVACFAMPAFLALWTTLAWQWWGWLTGAVVLVTAPLVGLWTVAWRERLRRAGEEVSLFLRLAPDRGSRDRMARYRAELVAEFERVRERMEAGASGRPRATAHASGKG